MNISNLLPLVNFISVGIYLFRVINGNTRTMYQICSKLILKALSDVSDVIDVIVIVNLAIFTHFFGVSIINGETNFINFIDFK